MSSDRPEPAVLQSLSSKELNDQATQVLASIQDALSKLEASLDSETATDLRERVDDLVAIVEQLEKIKKRTLDAEIKINDWKDANIDRIRNNTVVLDALTCLDSAISEGQFKHDTIEAILKLCEGALEIQEKYTNRYVALQEAVAKEDYLLTSKLAEQSETLKRDLESANSRLEEATVQTQTKNPTAIPDVKTGDQPQPLVDMDRHNNTSEKIDRSSLAEQKADSNVVKSKPSSDQVQTQVRAVRPESKTTAISASLQLQSDDFANQRKKTDRQSAKPDESSTSVHTRPTIIEIEEGISNALQKHRFALAYHLAVAEPNAIPTPNAVKLVAANFVHTENLQIISDLPMLAADLQTEVTTILSSDASNESKDSYVALIVSSCLWPSTMIAPSGPLAQLIKYLVPRLHLYLEFQELALTVADISLKGITPLPSISAGQESSQTWKQQRDQLESQIHLWIASEEQTNIKFAPATLLWRHLLKDWEPSDDHPNSASIAFILKSLIKADSAQEILQIQQLLDHWCQNVDKEIDRIDGTLRHLRASKDRIHGPARARLKQKIQDAIALADRWKSMQASQPRSATDPQTKLHRQLMAKIDEVSPALERLDTFTERYRHSPEIIHKLVVRYLDSFKSSSAQADLTTGSSLDILLSGDLYASPDIEFSENGSPNAQPSIQLLLRLVNQTELDFFSVAIDRAHQGRFDLAEYAISYAEQRVCIPRATTEADQVHEKADQARESVGDCRTELQEQLSKRLQEISARIDATYALGTLDVQEADQLRAQIPQPDRFPFSEIDNFIPVQQKLTNVMQKLDNAKASLRESMLRRLESLSGLSESDRDRIKTAIDNERFLIADEFLDWLAQGDIKCLPDSGDYIPLKFEDFYPVFVEGYCQVDVDYVRDVLEHRLCVDLFDASELPEHVVVTATALLNTWSSLRNADASSRSHVEEMMRTLGFNVVAVEKNSGDTFIMKIDPIADRDVIALPAFGSRANGRYQIIIIRNRNAASAIVRSVRQRTAESRSPIIVIFMNVLNVDERRSLVTLLHSGDYRPVIVLDEALLVFLATRSCDPCSLFFTCAAAFSVTSPYDPDTPEVPREMFFGRQVERSAILNMSGNYTHLVYGGRRLGKTALFADIANEFSRDPESIVLHLNLQGSGLGDKPDDLWQRFAKELSQFGVVRSDTRRYEAVAKGVQGWLAKKESRRILLLVDESDDFLEADRLNKRERYRVLAGVKELMRKTGRRFKVVFAGLHNVQRTARDPNTPLAHLGSPVSIGPMLPNDDGQDTDRTKNKEIENLIRLPFEAMGYQFESRDSIIRIAAETNYYPALAQQFCKELLIYLRRSSASIDSGPPYKISQEAVDRVFGSRETRDRIRNLFLWTIELDTRYEFLTYLIAYHSFDDGEMASDLRSISLEQIRTDALDYWRQGFSGDSSYLTFEVLLDEMVGLGILREESQLGTKMYGIRSRNLRRLLGQLDEVERKLHDATQKDSDPHHDWAQFRNVIGVQNLTRYGSQSRSRWGRDDKISPLSSEQERLLCEACSGIVVVFGTKMAGLDRIPTAVSDLASHIELNGQVSRSECEECNVSSAVSRISKIARTKAKSGSYYHFVVVTGPIYADVMNGVIKALGSSQSKTRIIRPVFVCDPAAAWRWLDGGRVAASPRVQIREIWLGRCARNFVRRLLRDRPGKKCEDLESVGGGGASLWPKIVELVASDSKIHSVEEAVSVAAGRGDIEVQDVLDVSEVESTLRKLCEFGGLGTSSDLSELQKDDDGEGVSEYQVSCIMQWAEKLDIVDDEAIGYRLDAAWVEGLTSASTPR